MNNKLLPLLLVFFGACTFMEPVDPDNGGGDDSQAINELINGIAKLDNAIAPGRTETGRTTVQEEIGADVYTCEKISYSLANTMNEIVAFNANAGALYPGAIVQGRDVPSGILTSIGSFSRAPMTFTMENTGISRTVEGPSNATVGAAIQAMLTENSSPTAAKLSFQKVEAYSKEQALLDLGIRADWVVGNIGTSLELDTKSETNSLYLYFVQEYYTVSAEQPATPASFFGDDVTASDLSARMANGNPPGFLSSVTYGRIVLAKITSTATVDAMRTALEAGYKVVSGELVYETQQVLEQSQIEAIVIGGSASEATNIAVNGAEGLYEYLINGANFSSTSPGLPISYTVRYLADNSLFTLGQTTTYEQKTCSLDPSAYKEFELYIYGFAVENDCDDGVFTDTGEGEFYFEINAQGENIITVTTDAYREADNGEHIFLDITRTFQVRNSAGNCLNVNGYLAEHDFGNNDDEVLGTWSTDHCYPFAESDLYNIILVDGNGTEEYYWETPLIQDPNDCAANLWYRITPKE